MKGYSLNIGLNYVDPTHYGGWDGKLISCENDAFDMQAIANSLGYNTETLIREQATRQNVIDKIEGYAKTLNMGDILYISYSGHGGQIKDVNSDEEDALDETWCLYDGQLIDDEFKELWSLFKAEVRIFVTSDSCHSGTVIKNRRLDNFYLSNFNNDTDIYTSKDMPSEIANRAYYNNKAFYDKILDNTLSEKEIIIKCSVLLLSGCQDHQLSFDGPFNGVFTAHLKKVWNGGKFSGNYGAFHKKINDSIKSIGFEQTPNLLSIGLDKDIFKNQIPFNI